MIADFTGKVPLTHRCSLLEEMIRSDGWRSLYRRPHREAVAKIRWLNFGLRFSNENKYDKSNEFFDQFPFELEVKVTFTLTQLQTVNVAWYCDSHR